MRWLACCAWPMAPTKFTAIKSESTNCANTDNSKLPIAQRRLAGGQGSKIVDDGVTLVNRQHP